MPVILTKPPAEPASTQTPSTTPVFKFPRPMIAIAGDSGSGKSTSYRNMPWDETLVIDTERKGFPFNHTVIKHYAPCNNHVEVETAIAKAKAGGYPGVKYVVIDSLQGYMEKLIAYSKANFKNFEVYTTYNGTLRAFLESLRNDTITFIVIAIPELVTNSDEMGKNINVRRMYTFGKEHEGKLEKEFLIVLWTTVRKGADNKYTYNFQTNTDGICSAKSPIGMFDTATIPNDLAAVLKRVEEHQKV